MSNSANVYCAFGEGRISGIRVCPPTWIFGKYQHQRKGNLQNTTTVTTTTTTTLLLIIITTLLIISFLHKK
jgi:hypothetical protein